MATYKEIIERLLALFESVEYSGAMNDEECEELDKIITEYYIILQSERDE